MPIRPIGTEPVGVFLHDARHVPVGETSTQDKAFQGRYPVGSQKRRIREITTRLSAWRLLGTSELNTA